MTPRVGETWEVQHTRKGAFTAKITALAPDFVDLVVVKGQAKMMSASGDVMPGDALSVRRTLLTFVRKATP